MKLTIITPTCRSNPRLDEVARTLAHSLSHAPADMELQWIIVDEMERDTATLIGAAGPIMELAGKHAMDVFVVPPLPSNHRRAGTEKAPAHNSARAAGLMVADGDYVILLNDCNVVTYGFMNVVYDCYKQKYGFRARMHEVADMAIPADGRVAFKDHHDLLRPIPATTAAGTCWGAPMEAFQAVRGFDRSYDGERYGNDLETIIRLSRVGVTFVTTERCFAIQLRRTKIAEEITTRKDVIKGKTNHKMFNQLMRDKARIHPMWEMHEPTPAPKAVAPAAVEASAAADAGPPRPSWKRKPPVVGGGQRPSHQQPNQLAKGRAPTPQVRPAAGHPPASVVSTAPGPAPGPGAAPIIEMGQGKVEPDSLDDDDELDAAIGDLS